jgi:hypothetical protein
VTETAYLVPAADLLPYWPHDLLAPTDVPVIGPLSQRVGLTTFDVVEWDGLRSVSVSTTDVLPSAEVMNPPGRV